MIVPSPVSLRVAVPAIRQRSVGFLAVLAVLACVGLVSASTASAYIYWTRSDTTGISRANLDGTGMVNNFLPTVGSGRGVAASGGYVYWANADGTIGRATAGGAGVNNAFISTPGATIIALAISADHIYWTWVTYPPVRWGVGRAKLDGGDVQQSFIVGNGLYPPGAIAVGGKFVFWVADNSPSELMRASIDGTGTAIFTSGGFDRDNVYGPVGVAADGQHVYTNDNLGAIRRLNLDGSAVQSYGAGNEFGFGGSPPYAQAYGAFAVDSSLLYWSTPTGIGRGGLDGTFRHPSFMSIGYPPQSLAVDPYGPDMPVNLGPPAISGTAIVGYRLSVATGSWSGTPPLAYRYQWQRCDRAGGQNCIDVLGATTRRYPLTTADLNARMRVVETASNGSGLGNPARSGVTAVVERAPTIAQIRAQLHKLLTPTGSAAKITALRRNSGYTVTVIPVTTGSITVSWIYMTARTHGAKTKAKSKSVLVATGKAKLVAALRFKLVIKLTVDGKRLLRNAKQLKLAAHGTYAPFGRAAVTAAATFNLKR